MQIKTKHDWDMMKPRLRREISSVKHPSSIDTGCCFLGFVSPQLQAMTQVNASYSSQPGLRLYDTAKTHSTSLLLPSQTLDPTGSRSNCACPMGQSSCWDKAHSYQQWASMEESKRYMWTCTWTSSTRTVKGKYIKILSGLEGILISTFLHFSQCINLM